ncbi:MAG: iron ABC transporter permease [Prevotella sp.]|nr:iron ABC transporter permease [Prevotella sp.]
MNSKLFWIVALVAVVVLFALNILTGSVRIPALDVLNILMGEGGQKDAWSYIVLESRLPQALTALLCGGALAVCGLLLQTAFRNPLAGPGIFGITNGAGLGVALVMLALGGSISTELMHVGGFVAIMAAAFMGAMLITGILFLFSSWVKNSVMLLIVGMMTGYLSSSAIALLNYVATEEGVRSYMLWGMGSFSGVSMQVMPLFVVLVVVGVMWAFMLMKPLNALLLGDHYAESLGLNVRRVRQSLLVVTGLLCAVTTAFCGPIAFIGLAVPHIARLLIGTENHRRLLPATLLTGSVVALLCNFICTLPEEGLVPLNAVTPLVGAPVIIYVILKEKVKG